VDDPTARYAPLCQDCGRAATRNTRGVAHEKGAIEGPHGHRKRESEDARVWRGSRDLADRDADRSFINGIIGRINARHDKAITVAVQHLQALPTRRNAECEEVRVRGTATRGFTRRRVFCSVPTRLIGHRWAARVHADRIALCLGAHHCLTVPRKHHRVGPGPTHVINDRHAIGSLKTRPGALPDPVCRDDLFPRVACQPCFETALAACGAHDACRLTVTLLAMAHEDNCEGARATDIAACLDAGTLPCPETLRPASHRRERRCQSWISGPHG